MEEIINLDTPGVLKAIESSMWFDYVYKDPVGYTDQTISHFITETLWSWNERYRHINPLAVLVSEDVFWVLEKKMDYRFTSGGFTTFSGWPARVASDLPHEIVVIGPAQEIVEQSVFTLYNQPYQWRGLKRPLDGRASMLIPILREHEPFVVSKLAGDDLGLPSTCDRWGRIGFRN